MRPNNQKQRSRGRNNNGRKHSNPLSRNFESNGPDVKIRGNATHIAEKYVQLARDAQASGDSVMAENYLQHAEHYFRIVSAAQAQNAQRMEQSQAQQPQSDDDGGDDSNNAASDQDAGEAAAPQSADSKDETAQPAADETEAPRKRERRPRRKPRATEEAASPQDAGNGPQPEVGELPAFLTGGQPTAAE